MSTHTRFVLLASLCMLNAVPAYAGESIADTHWRTFEHAIGLENNGTTPFVVLTRAGKKLELRPSKTGMRCGADTWEHLMNALAMDSNRTVRMRTMPCGKNVQVFIDTIEGRADHVPPESIHGFIGTVSFK